MSIVLQGSTSGSITLQEPAIAGSNTINLPAATGTMALLQTPSFATTIGVGGATPSTSGAGITFPATQSASTDANTLDDYEEGTWTPTVQGVGSAGTATYSVQVGSYTKIGNLVSVNVYLTYTGGTGIGQLRIAGFPFTSSGTYLPIPSVYIDNIAYTANNFVQAVMNSSSTTVDFYQVNGGGSAAISYDAAGTILLSLTYRV